MIEAVFRVSGGKFTGFIISGHAGAAEYGKDIVCAAVTSAVMLTLNTAVDFDGGNVRIKISRNKIGLKILQKPETSEIEICSEKLTAALYRHLNAVSKHDGRGKIRTRIIN